LLRVVGEEVGPLQVAVIVEEVRPLRVEVIVEEVGPRRVEVIVEEVVPRLVEVIVVGTHIPRTITTTTKTMATPLLHQVHFKVMVMMVGGLSA
jgi:hypothetical protein